LSWKANRSQVVIQEKRLTGISFLVINIILNAVKGLSVATGSDYLQNKKLTLQAGKKFVSDFRRTEMKTK
jgi:hypothetical protein